MVVPEWTSRHNEMLRGLKRIDFVAIKSTAKRCGMQMFVIEIYYDTPNSRIPTNNRGHDPAALSTGCPILRQSESRKPDARMDRRYAEFAVLQSHLQNQVQGAHGIIPCDFCHALSSAPLWGHSQRSALSMLSISEEELMTSFAKSINAILQLISGPSTPGRRVCSAREKVPQMLHNFLLQENLIVRR